MKLFLIYLIQRYKMMNRAYINYKHVLYSIGYLFSCNKANPKIDINKINRVIFIAHPDDEILSMGNFVLNNPENLLIICITNGGNLVRLNEFTGLMTELKIQYQIWNYKDGLDVKWNQGKVREEMRSILNQKNDWEMVITHNRDGDYGHYQHKQVYTLVTSIYQGPNLFVPISKELLIDQSNELIDIEYENKVNVFRRFYKSQLEILDKHEDYFKYERIVREG